MPHKIVHVITSLDAGGAEKMLARLLAATDFSRLEPAVVCLKTPGVVAQEIMALGIPVTSIALRPGQGVCGIGRLLAAIRQQQPDILQGWMYHGNLAAQLGQLALDHSIPVLWNIRQSLYDLRETKRETQMLIRLGARLSSLPKRIIYNAYTSARHHERIGYSRPKRLVIPNGFDTQLFAPSPTANLQIRQQWDIPHHASLIGLIARYHPIKDHPTFLQAAALLLASHADTYFLLAGDGIGADNPELSRWIAALGIAKHVRLCGVPTAINTLTAALDIATSSSYGEGFSNTIGEAMSCGVPCVVSDVGDSSLLVGNTGIVVPPKNPESLAAGWRRLLEMGAEERAEIGRQARARIVAHYTIQSVVQHYQALYELVVEQHR